MTDKPDPVVAASRAFLKRFGENCGKRLPEILPEIGLQLHYRNATSYEGIYKLDARLTKGLPIGDRVKLNLNFEAFNVTNTPADTSINHQAYVATNGVLTPSVGYGTGVASAGFPDGTNVRRAQVSLRLVF